MRDSPVELSHGRVTGSGGYSSACAYSTGRRRAGPDRIGWAVGTRWARCRHPYPRIASRVRVSASSRSRRYSRGGGAVWRVVFAAAGMSPSASRICSAISVPTRIRTASWPGVIRLPWLAWWACAMILACGSSFVLTGGSETGNTDDASSTVDTRAAYLQGATGAFGMCWQRAFVLAGRAGSGMARIRAGELQLAGHGCAVYAPVRRSSFFVLVCSIRSWRFDSVKNLGCCIVVHPCTSK